MSLFHNFHAKLTVFAITSHWLMLDAALEAEKAGGSGPWDAMAGPFECETWVDGRERRQRAKIVIGPTGCDKHAWGPANWAAGFPDTLDYLDRIRLARV